MFAMMEMAEDEMSSMFDSMIKDISGSTQEIGQLANEILSMEEVIMNMANEIGKISE
jgi:hypothetical protein